MKVPRKCLEKKIDTSKRNFRHSNNETIKVTKKNIIMAKRERKKREYMT